MAIALRLLTLSNVVAHVNARWFQTASNVGDWALVTPTAQPVVTSTLNDLLPKTTAPPRKLPLDRALRLRDDNASTICGYPVDGSNDSPVTCGRGEYCVLDDLTEIVGCCTQANPRDCVVPTRCLESSQSWQWSGDQRTTYCSNSARPHCVTRSYNDDLFFDPLYGASFVGCAAKAASGDIMASPASGNGASSTELASTLTTDDGATTASSTVDLPSSSVTGQPHQLKGSNNTGAIIGGTIGGVAGLALIIAAVLFLFYRRRKQSQSQDGPNSPPMFGQKMPPGDHYMYPNEPIPGSQYPSTFFGEAPPGMIQASEQPVMTYPANAYGTQDPILYAAGYNHSSEAPTYHSRPILPTKPQDDAVSPIEESPVSPVSPAENYNTMVSALSNQSPPLQPLQPAVYRPSSEYAQYSPPPPEQYQSYRPYPGT